MFALDTNTVIHYLKGKGQIADHMLGTPPAEIYLPSVVVYELEAGIRKSNNATTRRSKLELFLKAFQVLPLGSAEAEAAAAIRARLEMRGEAIGPLDILIAGTALAHNATLVTRNTGEFSRVDGLTIVNWYD